MSSGAVWRERIVKRRVTLVIGLLIVAFLFQQTVFLSLTTSRLVHAGNSFGGRTEMLPPGQVRGGMISLGSRLLDYSWKGWRPATCMPDRCFCERIRPGIIRQPVNTWSNLAFVLTGLFVIAMAGRDLARASRSGTSNPMRTRPVYPIVYGIATILIGIGSIFYHMSLAFAGQVLDVLSMYLLTSFMLLYNLSRMRRMRSGTFVVCYLLLNVAVGYISIRLPVLRRYLFLALLLAVGVSKLVVRRKRRPRMTMAFLYAGLVSLVMACAIWILDVTRVVCAPGSWFQGHAMWHVLMAALIGFMYLYYRSEDG
jgi:hypothetical protein